MTVATYLTEVRDAIRDLDMRLPGRTRTRRKRLIEVLSEKLTRVAEAKLDISQQQHVELALLRIVRGAFEAPSPVGTYRPDLRKIVLALFDKEIAQHNEVDTCEG